MPKTVEAVIDENGQIRLLESLPLRTSQRVLVTVLDEEAIDHPARDETAQREGEVWNREEEDKAWEHLSLSWAMRGMEDEEGPDYTTADLKEHFS